jgi:3-deoxy-D-manno-octulosonic-acid transferase
MSARSQRRWQRLPKLANALLASFEACLAQSAADVERFRVLGAQHVHDTGNLKAVASPLPAPEPTLAGLRALIGARPVWLAASTHPDEDLLLLEAHRALAQRHAELLTILVPRHPERGAALESWLLERGISVARRSMGAMPKRACALYLADTLGELGLFYRLAMVAFIGKSLAGGGGQNPLEAARLGCPLLFGPHMTNFAEPAAELLRAGAARQVADAGALAAALAELLADPAARAGMVESGVAVAKRDAGVLDATLAALAPLLERTLGPADAGA